MQLRQIATVQMGCPFRARLERDSAGNVEVIQMKDISGYGQLDSGDLVRIQMHPIQEQHLVRQGDIIFRSRGETNKAALVGRIRGATIAAAPLLRIRLASKSVLPAYVAWYVNQPPAQAYLASHSKGTSVRMISKEALQGMEIPVPSLKMQQEIVAIAALAAREHDLLRQLADKRRQYTEMLLLQFTEERQDQGPRRSGRQHSNERRQPS